MFGCCDRAKAPLIVVRTSPAGVAAGVFLERDDSVEAEALLDAIMEGARPDVGVAAREVELVDDHVPAVGLDGADEVAACGEAFLVVRELKSDLVFRC